MYLPEAFKEHDLETLAAFMSGHPFATLVTAADALYVSHLPLSVVRRGGQVVLAGHVARDNDHWRGLTAGAASMAIFHGPHAYVSPTWYSSWPAKPAVPTWNYLVVHATGPTAVFHDAVHDAARITGVVAALTDEHEGTEPAAWRMESLPAEACQGLLGAIVAFELVVEKLEGKFKLSQTRDAADRAGVAAHLAAGDETARAVAARMRESEIALARVAKKDDQR